jgi:hypothetical protein
MKKEKVKAEEFEVQKRYVIKKTYIGKLGIFIKGNAYALTVEQFNTLKEDLK